MGGHTQVWAGLRRWLAIVWLSALLAGCAAITLVPPYDEQIDTGLTTLYADTTQFVDRMIAKAGTADGTYASNSAFYEASSGRIEALLTRAEAHRALRHCPATTLTSGALSAARLPADVRSTIGTLPQDDCQVVLLTLIRDGFGDMAEVHKARGVKGLPPEAKGQFIDGGVGAQLRAAITVEIAKHAEKGAER